MNEDSGQGGAAWLKIPRYLAVDIFPLALYNTNSCSNMFEYS